MHLGGKHGGIKEIHRIKNQARACAHAPGEPLSACVWTDVGVGGTRRR